MTYIDFYFNVENKLNKIYGIIEKEIFRKRKMFVAVNDLSSAEALSNFLYTHSVSSFLPHTIGSYEKSIPIHIDWEHRLTSDDFIINLKPDVSPLFSRYLSCLLYTSDAADE